MVKEIVKIVLLTNFTIAPSNVSASSNCEVRQKNDFYDFFCQSNYIFRRKNENKHTILFLLAENLWMFFSLFFVKACGKIIVYYFQTYRKMTNIDETMRESDFHKRSKGLNEMKVADRLQEFGPNFIKISVPPILYLVFHEVIYAPSTFNLQIYFQNEMTLVLEFQF